MFLSQARSHLILISYQEQRHQAVQQNRLAVEVSSFSSGLTGREMQIAGFGPLASPNLNANLGNYETHTHARAHAHTHTHTLARVSMHAHIHTPVL